MPSYEFSEVVEMIEAMSGHYIDIRLNPAFVRVGEVKTLCGDAGLLRSLIGNWQTLPLQETLRWMLDAK